MEHNTSIFVTGHKGMVGSAICRKLQKDKRVNVITADKKDLDLLDTSKTKQFFQDNKINQVYACAGRVGGIHANNEYPADFIYENLMIECNTIKSAYESNIKKLLFLGSSCIYPKMANQPMKETELCSGSLESTNEPYAIAKIAGIKLCESFNRQYGTDYRSVMPTNLYGENDNFHYLNSHVAPALLRRIHEAKVNNSAEIEIWGSGKAKREFMHVDDMADASVFIMNLPKDIFGSFIHPMISHVNIGTGKDCSIKELVEVLCEIIDYKGEIVWDTSKSDGHPRKLLDISLLEKMGWSHSISLKEGLSNTYEWYIRNENDVRK